MVESSYFTDGPVDGRLPTVGELFSDTTTGGAYETSSSMDGRRCRVRERALVAGLRPGYGRSRKGCCRRNRAATRATGRLRNGSRTLVQGSSPGRFACWWNRGFSVGEWLPWGHARRGACGRESGRFVHLRPGAAPKPASKPSVQPVPERLPGRDARNLTRQRDAPPGPAGPGAGRSAAIMPAPAAAFRAACSGTETVTVQPAERVAGR